MSKYSLINTTKEQRKKLIVEANAISDLSGTKLSESGEELLNRYVDGELEIEEVQNILMVEKIINVVVGLVEIWTIGLISVIQNTKKRSKKHEKRCNKR